MAAFRQLIYLAVLISYCISNSIFKRDYQANHYYAIRVGSVGSLERAQTIADDLGLTLHTRIGEFKSHFWMSASQDRSHEHVQRQIDAHPMVLWADRQIPVKRVYKRDLCIPIRESGNRNTSLSNKRAVIDINPVKIRLGLEDPGFQSQWHLFNVIEVGKDMNITGVWELGITGIGSRVAFIDDGLESDNPDIHDNFSLEGSYDFNLHQKLPTPMLFDDYHGTRCASISKVT